jgi:hypothetical protein
MNPGLRLLTELPRRSFLRTPDSGAGMVPLEYHLIGAGLIQALES